MTDFAPLYTTPTGETVARFLESRYELGAPLNCRLLNRGFNDNYLVSTATNDRYVFRLSHLRARGPADVATETAFLAHLERSGAPVAAPIATRTGALFLCGDAPEGVREGVLFRALDGRAPNLLSAADSRATGVTLAKVHQAAENFQAEAPRYRLDLEHLIRRPLDRMRRGGFIEDKHVSPRLAGIAERTATRVEAFGNLTWTHCHGDCHGLNGRIRPDGEAAFFDFDDGGPGYLAYDLAVFLWAKISFGRKLANMWLAFLDGYRSKKQLRSEDLEAAQAMVIARHLWIMGEYASRSGEWGSESVDWISGEVDFLETWEEARLNNLMF